MKNILLWKQVFRLVLHASRFINIKQMEYLLPLSKQEVHTEKFLKL